MKNLKRALSFALASVMLIGMMAVGASAKEFTDAEQIEHTNAVNTLVALNVVSGKEDGSYYDPLAVVTRGEMAKMVTVALNGGKDPVLNTNAVPTYTDIKGHWAEKYIEYCAALGIIAGRGDGTFDPYGTVTGVEAAKMMLVAQGWESKIFGFTGPSWAANVNIEANKIELYDELDDIEPSEGLTRDNAAQLIYNGILAPIMTKDPTMEVTGGEISWTYGLKDDESIFQNYYKGSIFMGLFTGNAATGHAPTDGQIQVVGNDEADYEGAGDDTTTANFPYDFDIANIGEEVKVLYKNATNGVTGPDSKDKIYGVFTTGGVKVVNTTVDKITKDYADADNDYAVEIDDKEYDIATDAAEIVTNYIDDNTALDYTNIEGLAADNGDTVKFILNKDDEIVSAYVVESTLSYVSAVSATKVSINGLGSITIEDHEVYEGIAKDDFVVVTTLYADDYELHIVEKPEVVSGTVEGYTKNEAGDASAKVVVDGTTYKVYNAEGMGEDNDSVDAFEDEHIEEDFDLYLVNGYVGAAVQTSESASNYSVIIEKPTATKTVGNTFDPAQIKVLDAEGNKTILTLNDDSVIAGEPDTEIADTTQLAVGDLITWTGTADDAAVTVVAQWDSPADDGKGYRDSTKAYKGVTVATNAVLFAETSDEFDSFKAYTLRGLEDFSDVSIGYERGGKIVAVVADMTKAPGGATDTTVYGIVSANNGVVKYDGGYYTSYTVENDTDTYTVKVDGINIAKGDLVAFEPSTTGAYSDEDDFTVLDGDANGTQVWVKEYNTSDETLAFWTNEDDAGDAKKSETLPVDEDVKIVYVDVNDTCAGDDIGVNAYDETVNFAGHVMIVTEGEDDDETVVAILVETSGKVDILGNKVTAKEAE